jgi:hypothetical protein
MSVVKDKQDLLSLKRLKEVLRYEYETGLFYWLISTGRVSKDQIAGSTKDSGYILIRIDGIRYPAHRLAWFYCFEEGPIDLIDHIDRNRSNNKLDNLREATMSENMRNTDLAPTNSSGFRGVSYVKSNGKFLAQIKINGINTNLGHYTTPEEASIVYWTKVDELQDKFINEKNRPNR